MKRKGKMFSGILAGLLMLVSFSNVLLAGEGDYVISDNSDSFQTYMEAAKSQSASHIKVGVSRLSTAGNAVIDSSVSKLTGWQIGNGFDQEGVREREIGYMTEGSVTFTSGSKTEVTAISFYKRVNSASSIGTKVIINSGAFVYFKDCKFSNTVVNNGNAVFENNGTATYTGSTIEPTNTGTPVPVHTPLGITLLTQALPDGVKKVQTMIKKSSMSFTVPIRIQLK